MAVYLPVADIPKMELWYNPNIESHRDWLENFGATDQDNINDNTIDTYVSAKEYPTVEITVPSKSFTEELPEWINPVTGETLGNQTVNINVENHLGLYYFDTRQDVLDWITNTLDVMSDPVDEPDGEQDNIPLAFLPLIPDIYIN